MDSDEERQDQQARDFYDKVKSTRIYAIIVQIAMGIRFRYRRDYSAGDLFVDFLCGGHEPHLRVNLGGTTRLMRITACAAITVGMASSLGLIPQPTARLSGITAVDVRSFSAAPWPTGDLALRSDMSSLSLSKRLQLIRRSPPTCIAELRACRLIAWPMWPSVPLAYEADKQEIS